MHFFGGKFYLAKNAGIKVGSSSNYTRHCKINGVILYVKVHHKKPNDICYSFFYFAALGIDEKLPKAYAFRKFEKILRRLKRSGTPK